MYLAVFVLSIGFGVHTLQPATAVQPAQQYVSTDSTVNQLFDFFRAFFNQPDIDVKVKYLQEGIAVAEKNINRDIDLSRDMIAKLAAGLASFNRDIEKEADQAEFFRNVLSAVVQSFEARMRAIEDVAGIKRGMFS
jgi:hypothetical protein